MTPTHVCVAALVRADAVPSNTKNSQRKLLVQCEPQWSAVACGVGAKVHSAVSEGVDASRSLASLHARPTGWCTYAAKTAKPRNQRIKKPRRRPILKVGMLFAASRHTGRALVRLDVVRLPHTGQQWVSRGHARVGFLHRTCAPWWPAAHAAKRPKP